MDNEILIEEQEHGLSTNVFSNIKNFKEIYDIGKMFASSTLVPQAYQKKPMDCTIAIDMANRMGVSPMMVMQNLYVVQGKPVWNGQACMSMICGSRKFKNVHHIYTGVKDTDSWGCFVEATRVESGEVVSGVEVTIRMAKDEKWYEKSGSKWKTMPELMLAYRASAFFSRVHIPNALMGVHVEGEIEDINAKPNINTCNPFQTGKEILNKVEGFTDDINQ